MEFQISGLRLGTDKGFPGNDLQNLQSFVGHFQILLLLYPTCENLWIPKFQISLPVPNRTREQAETMDSKISNRITSVQLFKAQGFFYNMHAYTQHIYKHHDRNNSSFSKPVVYSADFSATILWALFKKNMQGFSVIQLPRGIAPFLSTNENKCLQNTCLA